MKVISKLLFVLFIISLAACVNDTRQTPMLTWQKLLNGNKRFLTDRPVHPDQNLKRIQELNKGQEPLAVVISCSDSRVPPELVFDQGLGDLFVVRNAGNLIGDYELGSVEYAVEHLNTDLVIVLGHQNCGAVQAYLEHKNDSLPNHIQSIVDYISAEPEEQELNEDREDYYTAAIKANIMHGVHVLKAAEPLLSEHYRSDRIEIIGAYYNLETGEVEPLEDLAGEKLSGNAKGR